MDWERMKTSIRILSIHVTVFFFFIPDIFCQMRFKNTVETDSSTGKKRGGERNSITPQRNYKVFTVLRLVADE